jgi:hypothetical protein
MRKFLRAFFTFFSFLIIISCFPISEDPLKEEMNTCILAPYPGPDNLKGSLALDVWVHNPVCDKNITNGYKIWYYTSYDPHTFSIDIRREGELYTPAYYKDIWDTYFLEGYFNWDHNGVSLSEGFYTITFLLHPWDLLGYNKYLKITIPFYHSCQANPSLKAIVNLSDWTSREADYGADYIVAPMSGGYSVVLTYSGEDLASVTPYVRQAYGATGHNHDAPIGQIVYSSQSETNGVHTVRYTYTPPNVSAKETLFFKLMESNGNRINVVACRVDVKTEGFRRLGSGSHYTLTGGTTTHLGPSPSDSIDNPNYWPIDMNHWGVSGFVDFLPGMADYFYSQYNDVLSYNDMSLPFGGRFDINADGAAPHSEHQEGINCDLGRNNLNASKENLLSTYWHSEIKLYYQNDINKPTFYLEDANHIHLRYDPIGE